MSALDFEGFVRAYGYPWPLPEPDPGEPDMLRESLDREYAGYLTERGVLA